MKKIRVGVVGLGHRGRYLVDISAQFDNVDIAAVCDIRPDNWYEIQAPWQEKPYSEMYPDTTFFDDYDRMLDEGNLDVVIVETGANIHAEFCCKALDKNINVLSDIPVVASLEEAEKLWKTAQKSTAMFSTGANPNYQKFVVMLNDFYNKGLLGKPYCMEAEYIHWSTPGGIETKLLNKNGDWRKALTPIRYCTHSLGPLLTILEEELRYVSCFGTGMHADDYAPGVKKDDMQCAQFRTKTGVVVRLMRNGRCRAKIGGHNYRVFGTEGYMENIGRNGKYSLRYNSTKELECELKEMDGSWMPPAYKDNPKAEGHGGVDYAMLDAFYKALENGEPAPINLKEGLRMTLPGIYAEESAKRNGEVIYMRYPWDDDWTTKI